MDDDRNRKSGKRWSPRDDPNDLVPDVPGGPPLFPIPEGGKNELDDADTEKIPDDDTKEPETPVEIPVDDTKEPETPVEIPTGKSGGTIIGPPREIDIDEAPASETPVEIPESPSGIPYSEDTASLAATPEEEREFAAHDAKAAETRAILEDVPDFSAPKESPPADTSMSDSLDKAIDNYELPDATAGAGSQNMGSDVGEGDRQIIDKLDSLLVLSAQQTLALQKIAMEGIELRV
jgi:hypothetical protein